MNLPMKKFHHRITISASFQVRRDVFLQFICWHKGIQQISASLDIRTWQASNDDAQAVDRHELYERLADLEGNQQRLMETLGICLWCISSESPLKPLH